MSLPRFPSLGLLVLLLASNSHALTAAEKAQVEAAVAEPDRVTDLSDAQKQLKNAGKLIEEKESRAVAAEKETKEATSEKIEEQKKAITYADLATGTLVEKVGLTGGIAAAVNIPINHDGKTVKFAAPTAMPYAAWFPAYSFRQPYPETRRFCANQYLTGDINEAQDAADALSMKKGERKFKRLNDYLSSKPSDKTGAKRFAAIHNLPRYQTEADSIVNDLSADLQTGKTLTDKKKNLYIERLAHLFWRATVRTDCTGYMFGVYVGIPLKYDAITSFDEPGDHKADEMDMATDEENTDRVRGRRTVVPKISFGAVYAPLTWLHLLAGVTYSQVDTGQLGDGEKNDVIDVWSVSLSAGGSLDLFNLFRGI